MISKCLDPDGGLSYSQKRWLLIQVQRSVIEKSRLMNQDLTWAYYTARVIQNLLNRQFIGDPLMKPFVVQILCSDSRIADLEMVEFVIELVTRGRDGVS